MTVIFTIFFFLFVVGIVMHLAQHDKEPQFKGPRLLPDDSLDAQSETILHLCAALKLTHAPGPYPLYSGTLDAELGVKMSVLAHNPILLIFDVERPEPVTSLEVQLNERHAKIKHGSHPELLLSLYPGLSQTSLNQIYLPMFETIQLTWKSEGSSIKLECKVNIPDHMTAPHLKGWVDVVHEQFKRSVQAITQQDQPWTQVALAQHDAHPLWSPALLYMAATEQAAGATPQWRALLERDAEYWQTLPPLPHLSLSFEDEPGELLGRAYPNPPAALMEVLLRRGELERMRSQQTLPSSLGSTWFELLSDEDPLKPQLIPYLDVAHLMRYLIKSYPLRLPDSIPRLKARLKDTQDPLYAQMKTTLEALDLWHNQKPSHHLLRLIVEQLNSAPELEPKLSTPTLLRLLTEHPGVLRDALLKQLLVSLDDRQFVELQSTLMTRTEPWTVFEHAMEHPTWRDYVSSNLNYKQGWSMVAAMLRDKKALNLERLRSINKFIEAPINDEEQARILREYFLVAQELGLHKELWSALLKTMKRSKAHQEALQFVHNRWEPLIIDRALMGGLSLSEDHSNAGALSIIHADQGSLTIQDEHEPS